MQILDLPCEMHNYILNMIENNDSTDAYRVILKTGYICNYMQSLSKENIKSRKLFPRPKFQKGQYVRFKKSWLDNNKQTIDIFKKEFNSDISKDWNKLCIIYNPKLDPIHKSYYYYIDYGFMEEVEAYVYEKDIELS